MICMFVVNCYAASSEALLSCAMGRQVDRRTTPLGTFYSIANAGASPNVIKGSKKVIFCDFFGINKTAFSYFVYHIID